MADAPAVAASSTFDKALTVTSRLTASRLAFRQFYDRYLQDRTLGPALESPPKSFLHAVFVAGRRHLAANALDRTEAAALALSALGPDDVVARAAASAVAAGLFDPLPGSDADIGATRMDIARSIRAAFGPQISQAILQNWELQGRTSNEVTFTDPGHLLPAILLANLRVCRVEAIRNDNGKTITGTGFLVGPSAIMTNWHVVEKAEPGSVRAVFDFSPSIGGAEDGTALETEDVYLAKSQIGILPPKAEPVGWWMDRQKRKAWTDQLTDDLDFVVVQLRGAPGLQRGWYDLSTVASFHLSGSCYVFHHPLGRGRAITAGEFKLDYPLLPERSFHSATTVGGSSGGLVINDKGQPVALHYLSLGLEMGDPPPKVPDEIVNVAIPLATIAKKLGPELANITSYSGLTLTRGCLDQGHPVFGRKNLLDALGPLARGEHRVLWVKPPTNNRYVKPGKSFTVDIIQTFFPPPRHLYIKVSADQVKAGAKAMAEMIMGTLSPKAANELPDPETTANAYTQVLIASMREIIASRWPDKLIWLVIDDLDVHQLTDTGGRELLNALYRRVQEIPQLRIVLIGLMVSLDSIPESALVISEILADDLDDIERLFSEWLMERGARVNPIDQRVRELLAEVLASYSKSDSPLAALSKFTVKHLDSPLKKFLDH